MKKQTLFLMAIVIFIINSSFIYGSTTTYWANSTNCNAYKGYGAARPPTTQTAMNTALTSTELGTISVDDSTYVSYSASGKVGFRIKIQPTENISTITQIDLQVKGYGLYHNGPDGTIYLFAMYIWNANGATYAPLLASHSVNGKQTLSYSITSNIANYFDSSNQLNFLAMTDRISTTSSVYLWYAQAVITYSTTPSNCWLKTGNIVFIPNGCLYTILGGVIQ